MDLCFEFETLLPARIKSEPSESKPSSTYLPTVDDKDNGRGLFDALSQWLGQDKALRYTDHLYYRLDSKYCENEFPPKVFSTRDRVVIDTLNWLTGKLPLEIYLARLERGDCDPSPSYLIRSLVDVEGRELLWDIPVGELQWVQARLPSLAAQAAECEVAVLLVARDSLVDFLTRYAEVPVTSPRPYSLDLQQLDRFLRYLCPLMPDDTKRDRLLPAFKDLCTRVWQVDEAKGLTVLQSTTMYEVLLAVVKAQEYDFLEQITARLGGSPPPGFFKWVTDEVVSGRLPLQSVEKSLLAAALTSTSTFDSCQILRQMLPLRDAQSRGEQLLQQLLLAILDDKDMGGTCSRAGESLAEFTCSLLGPEALTSKLLPVVERNATHTSFCLGVVNGIRHVRTKHPSQNPVLGGLFKQLAKRIVDSLVVSKLFQRGPHTWDPWKSKGCDCVRTLFASSDASGAVDSAELADFASDMLTERADGLLGCFILRIVADAGSFKPPQFTSLWLPFLRHLIRVLGKHCVPLSSPRYRHLFTAIMDAYLARCVGTLQREWTPKFREVYCMCRICRLFNLFLKSSVSAATFTSLSPSDMHHIKRYLVPYGHKSYRCQFTLAADSVIVWKEEEVDYNSYEVWCAKMMKARAQLLELNPTVMREILDDKDYCRIYDPSPNQANKETIPVPVESLEKTHPTATSAPELAVSTSSRLPQSSAPAPQSSYPLSPIKGYGPTPTTVSSALFATSRPATSLAPTPHLASSVSAVGNRGRLSAPITSSHMDSESPGYDLFASELGARLSKLSSFATPGSIAASIKRQWEAMPDAGKEYYEKKAAVSRTPRTVTATAAGVPFNPHKDRLPATPQPSTSSALVPVSPQEPRIQARPSIAGGRDMPGSRWGRQGPPSLTPTPRTMVGQTLPSSPSSRVFGAVSSSRLNSRATRQGSQKKIKAESALQPAPSRNLGRQVVEIVDLTGDDD
ncbi:hypothetical protein VTI74DRAFT_5201 [Chaetomium olivicolor]